MLYQSLIELSCSPKNTEKLTQSALAELDKLATQCPTQKELDSYTFKAINNHMTEVKKNDSWINALTQYQIQGGDNQNARPRDLYACEENGP